MSIMTFQQTGLALFFIMLYNAFSLVLVDEFGRVPLFSLTSYPDFIVLSFLWRPYAQESAVRNLGVGVMDDPCVRAAGLGHDDRDRCVRSLV
jgi:hypothetical protein